MTSGNVVYAPLVSGDLLMLNAQTGAVIKDLFTGAPMDVVPSIGATASGTEEVILTVGSASFFGPSTAGDLVALQLQNAGPSGVVTSTATAVSTTTAISTTTATTTVSAPGGGGASTVTATTTATTTIQTTITATGASTGVSSTLLYGIAAVAVIFIIATGFLAMRGRKPAS